MSEDQKKNKIPPVKTVDKRFEKINIRIHFYSDYHSLYSEYIDIETDLLHSKALCEAISYSNRVEYCEINPD